MRLNKDQTKLRVNPSLTLAGTPPTVFDYRLGNRSALDYVIGHYRVTEDARSGIRSDPNGPMIPSTSSVWLTRRSASAWRRGGS